MSLEEKLLSKTNISRLFNEIVKKTGKTNLSNIEMKEYRELMLKTLKTVYEKSKISKGKIPVNDLIMAINNKTIEFTTKNILNIINKGKYMNQLNNLDRERDSEIYGNREPF